MNFEVYWTDLCELLDEIELAFDASDDEKVDRLLRSRFNIARIHGVTVEILK